MQLKYSSFLYFYLFKFFFILFERDRLAVVSKLGSFKSRIKFNFFIFPDNGILVLRYLLLNNFNSNKNFTHDKIRFQKFISLFLISVYTGFRSKFKIVGRGYKLHKKNNNLIFKLGYSHLIFKTLDLSIYLKKKEKKKLFYTLISLNPYLMSSYVSVFKSYRIPNVFKRKGTFNNTRRVNFKFGKENMV